MARQDFFNSSFIRNSMVRQHGKRFTTITGGTGCPAVLTSARTPVTPPAGSQAGSVDWPASSITYGRFLDKFYYLADPARLRQLEPEVIELPQSELETADTVSVSSTQLDGCLPSPIMWGAATVRARTGRRTYTYIYGSQQSTDRLFLARTSADPARQGSWRYFTAGGRFAGVRPGQSCASLRLAPLAGLRVQTEFSVTSVRGNFWLVQQDPAGGTYPGWAVAHEARTPWTLSGARQDAVALFDPGVTAFRSVNDRFAGQIAYAVRMLDPAAVTASTRGDVVVAYNVNIGRTEADPGCVPLTTYDANAYRPRFIDVPIVDLITKLTHGPHSAHGAARQPAGDGGPAQTAALPAIPRDATPANSTARLEAPAGLSAPAILPSSLLALGAAQLEAASPTLTRSIRQRSAASSWTYSPDAVPNGNSYWRASCAAAYAPVDPNIAVVPDPDGSLELSWPNQGADVWYLVYWQDQTASPGVWNRNGFWTEGPNADGWQIPPAAGLPASDSAAIWLHFVPPAASSGDHFTFWVQAFAAGDSRTTSPDSAATATAPVAAQVIAPTGLTGTPDSDGTGVTLNWLAVTALPGESVHYAVYYKLATATAWSQASAVSAPTVDVSGLTSGQAYDFMVAAINLAGQGPVSAPISATP